MCLHIRQHLLMFLKDTMRKAIFILEYHKKQKLYYDDSLIEACVSLLIYLYNDIVIFTHLFIYWFINN